MEDDDYEPANLESIVESCLSKDLKNEFEIFEMTNTKCGGILNFLKSE